MLGLFASEMSHEYLRMREELRSVFDSWRVAVEQDLREGKPLAISIHVMAQSARAIPDQRLGRGPVRLKINRDRGPLDDFFNISFKMLLK